MLGNLPDIRLTGARILRKDGWAETPLSLADGLILPEGGRDIALDGYLVLPGLVDLSCAPLRAATRAGFGLEKGHRTYLQWVESELLLAGVTTAWIAQDWSLSVGEGSPDDARAMAAAVDAHRDTAAIDLRLQLCIETHMPETAVDLLGVVRRHAVDFALFQSEVAAPGIALADRATTVADPSNIQALRRAAAGAKSAEVPRHLCRLGEVFDTLGVRYGSHADEDAETRETYSMIGARIAKFPRSRRAAATARAMGDPVILRAPDVPSGGRLGQSSTLELIASGLCDALASSNHPGSLAHAAWTISDLGLLDVQSAWALISSAPAKILGLVDRGRLAPGLRADIVIARAKTRSIEAVVSKGQLVYSTREIAEKLAPIAPNPPLAAE